MKVFMKAVTKKPRVSAPVELSLAELTSVAGGLNPQPLPPSHDPDPAKRRTM